MKLFLTLLFIASSSAWEIPSFLFDSLPQSPLGDERLLDATEPALESLVGGAGVVQTTAGPTESPAPSPSPSEVPTQNPTYTPQPTRKPSSSPTESPAPSPSPSETPTNLPSDVPSSGPTILPTVSARPSSFPSTSPTAAPSESPSNGPTFGPTVSSAPSDSPSLSPTSVPSSSPSQWPSSSPTYVAPVNASITIALPIEISHLKPPQIEIVQRVAGYFFQEMVNVAGGSLQDVEVMIIQQEAVEVTHDTLPELIMQRENRLSNGLDLHQALNMTIDVVASYSGSDSNFDLKTTIEQAVAKEYTSLFQLLSKEDKVFSALAVDPELTTRSVPEGGGAYSPPRSGKSMSGGTIVATTLLSVGAILLGVAASIFALRSYHTATYGKELISPQSNSSSSIDILQVVESSKNPKSPKDEEEEDEEAPEFDIESIQDSVGNKSSASMGGQKSNWYAPDRTRKGSLDKETGGLSFNQLLPHHYTGKDAQVAPSISKSWSKSSSQQRAKDPPSAGSEIDFGLKDQFGNGQQNNKEMMASLFDNDTEFTESTRGRNSYSPGGKLGAAAASVTQQARTFFEGLTAPSPTHGSTTPLGARAVEPDEELQLHEKSSYDNLSASKRPGLYDVFAPAGPIGIVVDTTKYGPAVHSLKRTSPMLGLINPGDLIVGLDDEDTRGMTAATLTRLMARKSNQKERKITLLTME